jgi:hypothetical protein
VHYNKEILEERDVDELEKQLRPFLFLISKDSVTPEFKIIKLLKLQRNWTSKQQSDFPIEQENSFK